MSENIIRHTSNLDVGSNEYATKYSVNRIVQKLLENDKLLEDFYREVFGSFLIHEYDAGETYYYGDLVWFLDKDPRSKTLYILRCIKNETSQSLNSWTVGQSFQAYGWKDLNPDIDVMKEFGLENRISTWIAKKFKEHQSDETMHPLGKVSYGGTKPSTDISKIVANRQVSNLDPSRQQTFFPYQTTYLKTSSTILGGYCRKYDNGLLEYDITFRLSYVGDQEVDKDYGISASILECNRLDLASAHGDESYFYSTGDADVFCIGEENSSSLAESEIGDTRQRFRNDYVNVYSAKIDFAAAASTVDTPMPKFASADAYMIFSGDVLCQARDTTRHTMDVGSNAMTFAQRTSSSFVALLVTYPNQKFSTSGYNAQNGGIEANSFHCSVIGKWK